MSGLPRMSIREQAHLLLTITEFSEEAIRLFGDQRGGDPGLEMTRQYVDLYLELKRLDLSQIIRETERRHDPSA